MVKELGGSSMWNDWAFPEEVRSSEIDGLSIPGGEVWV